jgi:hypothetical protein
MLQTQLNGKIEEVQLQNDHLLERLNFRDEKYAKFLDVADGE